MASDVAKRKGLFTQLASMRFVMEEPIKMALSLVTLSEPKHYTAVVTVFKTLREQRITWNYTVIPLLDEYAQLNRSTASEEAETSSKAKTDTGYLASSSVTRKSSGSQKKGNTSTSKRKFFNCDLVGHFARNFRTTLRDCHRRQQMSV